MTTTPSPKYQTEVARDLLGRIADRAVVDAADAAVLNGSADWRVDPSHRDVVGLIRTGTNRALVVVYLDAEDFEVADEFMDTVR